MTALTDAAPGMAAPAIIRRYYLAMGVPFAIDLVALGIYASVHKVPELVLPTLALSMAFLVVGVGIGAYFLIRPISRFMAGETTFAEAEEALTNLPRWSAALVAVCYAPMQLLRMVSRQLGIDFGALLEHTALPDLIASVIVGTGFNVLLVFFVVSAFLDVLCENLFRTRGVNLGIFHGRFRRKVAIALLSVASAGTPS